MLEFVLKLNSSALTSKSQYHENDFWWYQPKTICRSNIFIKYIIISHSFLHTKHTEDPKNSLAHPLLLTIWLIFTITYISAIVEILN